LSSRSWEIMDGRRELRAVCVLTDGHGIDTTATRLIVITVSFA